MENIIRAKYSYYVDYLVLPCLFILFFFIVFGLGYAVLNRYEPMNTLSLSDAKYYAQIVQYGIHGLSDDVRSSRILLPILGHVIYTAMPDHLGSWNLVSLSMLIVNCIFCSLTAVFIYILGCKFLRESEVAIISALLYLLNFSVSNFYLAGLVDSGISFFFVLLTYALLNRNWLSLPLIAFLGCATKEIFFPIGTLFLAGWLVADYIKGKKVDFLGLFIFVGFVAISFVTVTALKSMVSHQLTFPWQYMAILKGHTNYVGLYLLLSIARFLYTFIWLLPLAIPNLLRLPFNWLIALGLSTAGLYFLNWWAGMSGAGFGRTLFDLVGPALCLSAGFTLMSFLKGYSRATPV